MKLENNQTHDQTHDQRMRESFNYHINDVVDCIITNLSVELTTTPAAFHNESAIFYMPEKRIFTYEGYTKSDKWFKLIINE